MKTTKNCQSYIFYRHLLAPVPFSFIIIKNDLKLQVESGIHNRDYIASCKASNDPELQNLVPDFYISSLGALLPYFSVL